MHAGFRTCIMFLLCSIVYNSKLARNLHDMFHDVQTSVGKKPGFSSLSFFSGIILLKLHLIELRVLVRMGEVGWFVCLF